MKKGLIEYWPRLFSFTQASSCISTEDVSALSMITAVLASRASRPFQLTERESSTDNV